jgi:hypothetical protein
MILLKQSHRKVLVLGLMDNKWNERVGSVGMDYKRMMWME